MLQLVRRARRRRLVHVLLHQGAIAAGIGLAASALLLITGTEILQGLPAPYLLPLIAFAVAFAILARRVRQLTDSDYDIAQDIDRRLALHDSLSTAIYFSSAVAVAAPADVVERQRRVAEEHARTADLARALPFPAHRAFYVSGCLMLLAIGLFAMRYGVTKSLDLRASLLRFAFHPPAQSSGDAESARVERMKREAREAAQDPVEQALNMDSPSPGTAGHDATIEPVQSTLQAGRGSPGQLRTDPGESVDQQAGEPGAGQSGKSNSGKGASESGAAQADAKGGGLSPDARDPGAQARSGQSDDPSLLDRMREAMAGLMSKLKSQQQNGQENKQSSRAGSPSSSGAQRASTQSKAQSQDSSDSPQDGTEQNSSDANAMRMSQNKGDQHGADSADSPEGRSGAGRQDGAKDPNIAKQLAAMGKIREIIGRRSQNLTGDVMVEVSSGKEQPLQTEYSGRRAAHNDTAGEISRDEIPPMYQQYVQDYFDQIRKLPPPKPPDSQR